jgi:hypothetical protein
MLGTHQAVRTTSFFKSFSGGTVMRLKQLAERRVSAGASGGSLRPLSQREVQQVAGGIYFVDMPLPGMPGFPGHGPYPGYPGDPFPGPGSELL